MNLFSWNPVPTWVSFGDVSDTDSSHCQNNPIKYQSALVGYHRPNCMGAAAKKWLVKNGMTRIQMAGKVSLDFRSKLCHN